MKPTKKMAAAGIGGAASVVLVWALSEAGVRVPADVAAAMSTLISFAAGWLRSD